MVVYACQPSLIPQSLIPQLLRSGVLVIVSLVRETRQPYSHKSDFHPIISRPFQVHTIRLQATPGLGLGWRSGAIAPACLPAGVFASSMTAFMVTLGAML